QRQQGGLARARRPEQHTGLSRPNRQRHVAQHVFGQPPAAVGLRQPLALQDRAHRYPRNTETGSTRTIDRTDRKDASRQHASDSRTSPAKIGPVVSSGIGVAALSRAAGKYSSEPSAMPADPRTRLWIRTTPASWARLNPRASRVA